MIDNKREQLEARDAQIETVGEFEAQSKEVAGIDFSTQALEELGVLELVDKWNQLDGDYIFYKWKLAWLISENFKSKKKFGQFLQQLWIADPNHPLCTIRQSTLYRYACAARFCDKFKINNPYKIGISPSAIYILSEKANESVVDYDFIRGITNKNLPLAEIKRLVKQAQSIPGELIPGPIQSIGNPEIGLLIQDPQHSEAIDNNDLLDLTEEYGESAQPLPLNSQPLGSCIEPTNQLTEAQVQRVMNLLESYNLKSVKKEDDKKAYFKISWIEYGEPAQVTLCIKSDW